MIETKPTFNPMQSARTRLHGTFRSLAPRRRFRRAWWTLTVAMLFGLGLLSGCAATDEYDPVEMPTDAPVISTDTISIYYLPLMTSNAYFIETAEGLILVDAGLPLEQTTILRKMRDLGWEDLCLIYITHAHVDHYGSAAALREATDAPIAVHTADAADMSAGRTRLGSLRDLPWSEETLPYVENLILSPKTEPDILLEDGDPITACGLDGEVVHTPGHTPGSSALLVEGTYAFVGDLLSTVGEAHTQETYAQDWTQLAESYAAMRARRPTVVFPGHGQAFIRHDTLETLEVEIGQNNE